jgi:hypothetical protein
MGYTIGTKQSASLESVVSTIEKCFAVPVVESLTFSAPVVSRNQPEVYFEIED